MSSRYPVQHLRASTQTALGVLLMRLGLLLYVVVVGKPSFRLDDARFTHERFKRLSLMVRARSEEFLEV